MDWNTDSGFFEDCDALWVHVTVPMYKSIKHRFVSSTFSCIVIRSKKFFVSGETDILHVDLLRRMFQTDVAARISLRFVQCQIPSEMLVTGADVLRTDWTDTVGSDRVSASCYLLEEGYSR